MLPYPILSYPILSYPICCYPTPSYPITLDDIILHSGPFLSPLILLNLIIYYPILTWTTMYHPIPPYPKISCPSLLYSIIVFCVCSHLLSLCNMVQPPHLTPLALIFLSCYWMKLYTALYYLQNKHAYPVVWPLQL